jgi:hypothetical protein
VEPDFKPAPAEICGVLSCWAFHFMSPGLCKEDMGGGSEVASVYIQAGALEACWLTGQCYMSL